jgi:hypothetical protein
MSQNQVAAMNQRRNGRNWRQPLSKYTASSCGDCGSTVDIVGKYCRNCQDVFQEKRSRAVCIRCDDPVAEPQHKFCADCFQPSLRKNYQQKNYQRSRYQKFTARSNLCRICEQNTTTKSMCSDCYSGLPLCATDDCQYHTMYKRCTPCHNIVAAEYRRDNRDQDVAEEEDFEDYVEDAEEEEEKQM